MSAASASDSPTIWRVTPTTAKSPLAQVACWRCLIVAKSGAGEVEAFCTEDSGVATVLMARSPQVVWAVDFGCQRSIGEAGRQVLIESPALLRRTPELPIIPEWTLFPTRCAC